jgi:hypothetical protein
VRHRASVLRQFSIASRQGLDAMVLWQFARGDFPRLRPKIAGETRENSIDRDSQLSTRRELERLDILLIAATALLITFGVCTGIKASEIE